MIVVIIFFQTTIINLTNNTITTTTDRMVEEIKMPDLSGIEGLEHLNLEEMVKHMNDPRYLESVQLEIDQAMTNAKIDLSQLGFDLDKERLDRMANGEELEEAKEEEIDETELERLLAGGCEPKKNRDVYFEACSE